MVDIDGKYTYSNVVSVRSGIRFSHALVYPNPTKGDLTLKLQRALTEPGDLFVTDLSGRTLMQQKLPAGQSACSLKLNQLPAGRYIIRISNASVLIRESVIVMQ